jgi:predicted AlkP superfamily pyrophosphatase or phosphodiesterase
MNLRRFLGTAACSVGLLLTRSLPAERPRDSSVSLIVVLVVDQMRPDYFERFGQGFTGGLRRLRTQGAFFTHGMQDHAITQTAPGHSTILSGRSPASTGILSNDFGVPDPQAPVIGAPHTAGASPRAFRGSSLYDWMLARDASARVLSVSRKDRGAILPVGRARGDVYWYAEGRFTSSRYYADSLPDWLRAYDARPGFAALAGKVWDLLLPASAYRESDSLPYENGGRDFVFPHRLPQSPDSLAAQLIHYPWMDSLTLDLALEGVRQTGLGRRTSPDLLVVSLSTNDAIGHDWGPNSRELHDHQLRLDHWLGWFLDSLATLVPRERTIFALTADHGTQDAPEFATAMHRPGGRSWLGQYVTDGQRLETRYHRSFGFSFQYGLLVADVAQLRALGVNVDSISTAWAAEVRKRPDIQRVYTPASLAAAPARDSVAALWRKSIVPGTGWLFAAVPKSGTIWSRTGVANHGTPDDADVLVPIIIAGPGVRAGTYARRVPTEDIGPTLAALIHIVPTELVPGHPLREVTAR